MSRRASYYDSDLTSATHVNALGEENRSLRAQLAQLDDTEGLARVLHDAVERCEALEVDDESTEGSRDGNK